MVMNVTLINIVHRSTQPGRPPSDWALAGGVDSVKKRINDPGIHNQIIKEMLES